jgi:hypothetical protein
LLVAQSVARSRRSRRARFWRSRVGGHRQIS